MLSLLDISTIYYLFHVMVLNALLCEYRYPKKKAIWLTVAFMTPLAIYNSWFFVRFGAELAGQMCLVNCTIPSLIFFLIVTKHRNGRILFTFCLSDTISLEIVYITRFIDDWIGLPDYWVLFILRLIAWPLLEFAIIKHLRKPYLRIQNMIDRGWGGLAAITLLFYILLLLMATVPYIINERPEYIPALLLVMVLMPIIYWNITKMLIHQQTLADMRQKEQLLTLQATMMNQRISQYRQTERTIAIARHDMRHKFHTLDSLLANGNISEAREFIALSGDALIETQVKHWCLNPVLDAVFASYLAMAESYGIKIEAALDIPEELHVDATELSTVFANALENAINAVKDLPMGKRVIRCKCIQYPQLMIKISNPYEGEITFDSDGIPVPNDNKDMLRFFANFTDTHSPKGIDSSLNLAHGLGTRSIAAYCEKHGAFCEYTVEDGWFTISIVQP